MIKAISKSKGIDVINKYRNEFVEGCFENKIPKDISNKIFDIIQESGAYSFNKSHAVGYSALSYITAWLKTYYPKQFLIATIHYPKDGKKEEKRETLIQAIRELRKIGYEVQVPDINLSIDSISIAENGGIYMGLSDVAGVGKEAVKEILLYQPYGSFDEFVGKVQKRKVKKNILLNLIQAGAFDKFERRDELYSRITEEPYRVWEDVEMLTRQMTVLDLPSAKPIMRTNMRVMLT
jgi:DNA polymerase-3 subunit alpha